MIHMINHAAHAFEEECVPGSFKESYDAYALMFAMIAAILIESNVEWHCNSPSAVRFVLLLSCFSGFLVFSYFSSPPPSPLCGMYVCVARSSQVRSSEKVQWPPPHTNAMSRVPISEEQAQQMLMKQQAQQERAEAMSEQKESLLRAFVSAEGRERLKRIEQVRADRAHAVEAYIIQSVRQGKLQPPVSDETVREILAQVSSQGAEAKSNITFARKRMDDDW
ncbi:programmed cell death protein 5 [Trypanosoma grayi]|uniref:programmed cell death protein 5 n=1 Tax=Trypanosoma grayi TaxID=71804 RepID=UPI0004F4ACD5|nr:programmed cell death protein 5 [Trypanosoma grayi]KEG15353.1 programmed cell death protein 5 [Trypanosoma grayi]